MHFSRNLPIYVGVTARFDKSGHATPLEIIWTDGTVFPIEKVITHQNAHIPFHGSPGVMFTVQVKGQIRYLYHEDGHYDVMRWMVEDNKGIRNR